MLVSNNVAKKKRYKNDEGLETTITVATLKRTHPDYFAPDLQKIILWVKHSFSSQEPSLPDFKSSYAHLLHMWNFS